MVLIVPVALGGGWWGTKHYLMRGAQAEEARVSAKNASSPSVNVSRAQPTANEVLLARLHQENENYKTIVAEYEARLRDAVAGWSAVNIQKARLEGRYPHDVRVKPGTSVVTAIAIDEVWVRGEDGKPRPYKLGQVIPGAGRLLGIDAIKSEAVAEQTVLRVVDPVTPSIKQN